MKKIGYFFFCFLPVIASFLLQFILVIPGMGLSLLQIFLSHALSGDKISYYELMSLLTKLWSSSDFTSMVSVLYAACAVLLFGFWYSTQFHVSLRQSPKNFANAKVAAGLIFMVPALQMMSSLVSGITASLFPGSLDRYQKLMESAGFGASPSVFLILYAVILGPIAEELTFRGVIFSSAKKALPLWAANIFQALLFGLFHMNVLQGIYAFCIGLVLGYIAEKGTSIYLSIFLHILFNSWGTFMSSSSSLYSSPLFAGIFLILSVILGILGFFLFAKNTPVQKTVKESRHISDM